MTPNLIVIVDPDSAEGLIRATKIAPSWIVETALNRQACVQHWNQNHHADHREIGAVTCFTSSNVSDHLGTLIEILPTLEEHHGVVEGNFLMFPNGFILEVVGLFLTEQVRTSLEKFGFASFSKTDQGFHAIKCGAEEKNSARTSKD